MSPGKAVTAGTSGEGSPVTLTVGVDVGGTKVLAGVVDPDGTVLATERRRTPSRDVNDTARVIAEVVRDLAEDYEVEAVGVGAAGWIDADRAIVLHSPNLAWRQEPLRDRIQDQVDLPVVIENDANSAAWAEFRFGAGRGSTHLMMFTVGTGIGGGAVVNGQLYRGEFGVAAEFGHVRVVPGGLRCGCGATGCFEQYASGSALVRYAREGARAEPGAAALLLGMAGGDADKIDGPAVTRAAREGDPVALAAFDRLGEWLGWGLADLVSAWDPGLLLVGGGVAESGELLMAPARRTFQEVTRQRGRTRVAELRVAALGNNAGLVGAADLARIR
jgi:glucokinase